MALGCNIARILRVAKMQKAQSNSDAQSVEKYNKSTAKLDIASTVSSGLTIAGLSFMIGGALASNFDHSKKISYPASWAN